MNSTSDVISRVHEILQPVMHWIDGPTLNQKLKHSAADIIDLILKAPEDAAGLYTPALHVSVALEKNDLSSAQRYLSEIQTQLGLIAGGGPTGQIPMQPILAKIKDAVQQANDFYDPDKNAAKMNRAMAELARVLAHGAGWLCNEGREGIIKNSMRESVASFASGEIPACRKSLGSLHEQLVQWDANNRSRSEIVGADFFHTPPF